MTSCPCGLGEPYDQCCGKYHRGDAEPPSASVLMRARYTAFALGDADFLRRTWHRRTRPASLELDASQRWTGLHITDHTGGGLFESEGTVAFEAHYTRDGVPATMRENSSFVRDGGRWVYDEAVP